MEPKFFQTRIVKKITKDWLRKHSACMEGMAEFDKLKKKDTFYVLNKLNKNKDNHSDYLDWTAWLIKSLLPPALLSEWYKEWESLGLDNDSNRQALQKIDAKYIKLLKAYVNKQEAIGDSQNER